VGFAAIAFILTTNSFPSWLLLLGEISYSLYLIHLPVGARVVNLGARFVPAKFLFLLSLYAVAVSVICATLMHLAIERPAKRWASKIKYRPAEIPVLFYDYGIQSVEPSSGSTVKLGPGPT
jgi:peptidoglycan/LPS O-acetylase OafA/YrhL